MTGPQKTLTDIWNEVQKEQRQFNKIVRYMMTALIVTALVVGAGVLMSWFKLNNLSSTYQQSIAEAEAQVAISRSTSISNRQTINAQLLALRKDLNEQRDLENLPRSIDRVLDARKSGADLPSFIDLRNKAIQTAENSALGNGMSNNGAYLIQQILEEHKRVPEENVLNEDQALLLNGVLTYWRNGPNEVALTALEDVVEKSNSQRIKGFGNSALAHFYYQQADENNDDSLGWDKGCKEAVDKARVAAALIVASPQTLLAKAECQRKGGYPSEAFKSFLEALETILRERKGDEISAQLRYAVHGTGTTLVALKSAETRDQTVTRRLPELITKLKGLPLPEKANGKPFFDNNADELSIARSLLNYAADLRAELGEGEITRLYSTENIGFIYLLQNDWESAANHAREIDEKLALGWNLTVFIIALEQQAKDTNLSRSERAALRAEAKFARLKLSFMRQDQLDVAEIKKLLPADYAHEVDKIVSSISGGQP